MSMICIFFFFFSLRLWIPPRSFVLYFFFDLVPFAPLWPLPLPVYTRTSRRVGLVGWLVGAASFTSIPILTQVTLALPSSRLPLLIIYTNMPLSFFIYHVVLLTFPSTSLVFYLSICLFFIL